MATKLAAMPEKLYSCEVKRRRVRANGAGYEPFWKIKSVQEALLDGDTEFRCMSCHGAVKLSKRNTDAGLIAHVQHKHRTDSEYCTSGHFFSEATDGREPRISATPVQ
jgi:hypothetical protein